MRSYQIYAQLKLRIALELRWWSKTCWLQDPRFSKVSSVIAGQLKQHRRRQEQHQAHTDHVGEGGQEDAAGGGWVSAKAFEQERYRHPKCAAAHTGTYHGDENHDANHDGAG